MTSEMSESERRSFDDRIAATAIVNQAALKCLVRGVPLTADNVVFMVGDFVDPERPEFAELIDAIMRAIDEVVMTASGPRHLDG